MKSVSVLFISPHLSTGGLPQYLYEKIRFSREKENVDAYVVEYSQITGEKYTVQRKKIQGLLGTNFYALDDDKNKLFEIIEKVQPQIISFEEIPESFVEKEILEKLYVTERKRWKIVESTHSFSSDYTSKIYFPDKFIMPCEFSSMAFSPLNIPTEVWEYPIEKKEKDRSVACNLLGLDSQKTHVLNVGLFTPGKNQKEFFEIARKFDVDIEFHCVGNLAENFRDYWEPLIENCPSNVRIWGEREDVETFYSASDIFLFTSTAELNPLVIKEALSYQLEILLYDMPSYLKKYDREELITYLGESVEENVEILRALIYENHFIISHIITNPNDEIVRESVKMLTACIDDDIAYFSNVNLITEELPEELPLELQTESKLTSFHFGCFSAFRETIESFDTDNFDFLVICERDCKLECTAEEFKDTLRKVSSLMTKKKLLMFSLGDIRDLEFGIMQSEKKKDLLPGFAFLTDKVIGLQCIVIGKRGKTFFENMFKKYPWHGMDIWFNEIALRENVLYGILEKRMTSQLDGFSLIDQTNKKFT